MLNVLIIEDDFVIASDIKSIAEGIEGYKGYIVSSMQSAMEVADKRRPHIIVSDIQIKGAMDGVETTRVLQNLYRCPVLFLTSFNDEATLKRVSKLDFSGYLLKPFKEDELVTSLQLCALKIAVTPPLKEIANGYSYDLEKQQVFFDKEPITLTQKEHRLFLLLLNAHGNVVPFSHIDDVIWNNDLSTDTPRRQLFHRLRSKLPELPIKTIKYQGFILES